MIKIWILVICLTPTTAGVQGSSVIRAYDTMERAVLTWHDDIHTSEERGYNATYQLYEVTHTEAGVVEKLLPEPDMQTQALIGYMERLEILRMLKNEEVP